MEMDNCTKIRITFMVMLFLVIVFCLGRESVNDRGTRLLKDGFVIIDPEGRRVTEIEYDTIYFSYWTEEE